MQADPDGRDAVTPWAMPWAGWKQIAARTWREASQDSVGLVAAGVAFYGFLALVPLLGAAVLGYGIVAQPATVLADMQKLTSILPSDAAKLVAEQLLDVVKASDGKKGAGLFLALALALFGARNGAGALITALNIAYEEDEKRGFLRLNLLALLMTAAAVAAAIVAVIAIAALGPLEALFAGMPGIIAVAGKVISYLALLLVGAAGAATLYRFGPSRRGARWIWLTPGSALAATLWLVLTLGFGLYVARFGDYNATYGSLGAVVVLLTWLYLSSYILVFGAELNSELERQTKHGGLANDGKAQAPVQQSIARELQESPLSRAAATPEISRRSRSAPSPAHVTARSARGLGASFAAGRAVQMVGLGHAGLVATGLASIGLAKLATRGTARAGVVLLAAAGALTWFRRAR